jgi:hypothetical protein
VAAIIHDLGQTTFGHDMEEACPFIFSHEEHLQQLLDETHWGRPSLRKAIEEQWPSVDIARVLRIVRLHLSERSDGDNVEAMRPIDGVASDAISGPIDADKFDYLLRDSVACGVPYGLGIDGERFVRTLTVTAKARGSDFKRLALAYKAKGRAAILSVLLARYQMWGAVYWHHAFRCIQAMYVHAAAATFGVEWKGTKKFREAKLTVADVKRLFYLRVIVGNSWNECCSRVTAAAPLRSKPDPPGAVRDEGAIEFIWRCANDGIREVLDMLAGRRLFKRVFEMRLGELGERADYSAMRTALTPSHRMSKATTLTKHLLDTVEGSMRERGPGASVAENAARELLGKLRSREMPLVLLDFPVRGVPEERNTPAEIGDAVRKYFVLPKASGNQVDDVFEVVRKLQQRMATVRVFAFPELHELVIRYLNPNEVKDCVERVIDQIRTE